eukprot:7256333-Ditylum_brightwellii.AAC.1
MKTRTLWVTIWLSSGAAGRALAGREFNSCCPQRLKVGYWGWDVEVELWGWQCPPDGCRGGHGKDTV